MGRQKQRRQRRGSGSEQPGQIIGDDRSGVAVSARERECDHPGVLAEGNPKQDEAEDHEHHFVDGSGIEKLRREGDEERVAPTRGEEVLNRDITDEIREQQTGDPPLIVFILPVRPFNWRSPDRLPANRPYLATRGEIAKS